MKDLLAGANRGATPGWGNRLVTISIYFIFYIFIIGKTG
jgi:hypothetical protein